MDEIKNKYILGSFKERPSKQKAALKFEDIDLGTYHPRAHCAAITTLKERTFHWIRSFQFCYYETLKDNVAYLAEWINRPGYNCISFQEIEIKINKVESNHTASPPDSLESAMDNSKFLITIHIYLMIGVIFFQRCAYQFWAEKEFAILKELADLSTQHQSNQDIHIPDDQALLHNLQDACVILLCKKTKTKAKKSEKTTLTSTNDDQQKDEDKCSTTSADACPTLFQTPLSRRRRNSLDSMGGLSARKSATLSKLKSVVSNLEAQITEINAVLKSQTHESL